jgi:hypothetical protein
LETTTIGGIVDLFYWIIAFAFVTIFSVGYSILLVNDLKIADRKYVELKQLNYEIGKELLAYRNFFPVLQGIANGSIDQNKALAQFRHPANYEAMEFLGISIDSPTSSIPNPPFDWEELEVQEKRNEFRIVE